MKNTILILSITFIFLTSCNKKSESTESKEEMEVINVKKENIKEKYPSEHFTECFVKGKTAFKGGYDFDAKKNINVDKSTKTETVSNKLINISDKRVILTLNDGRIISEYKVLSKKFNQDLNFFEYLLEKDSEKCLFSHIVDIDGSYSYFEFRTKDSLNIYLKNQ
jgi:hypothetical protein